MDREILVYVDLDGKPHLVGRLWARVRKNRESASFEYDQTWLENPLRFSLEPALQVGPGAFHTSSDTPIFGSLGDSAPDRWGRARGHRAAHAAGSRLPPISGRRSPPGRAPVCGKRGRTIPAAGGEQAYSA